VVLKFLFLWVIVENVPGQNRVLNQEAGIKAASFSTEGDNDNFSMPFFEYYTRMITFIGV